jgi:hypothetical protein
MSKWHDIGKTLLWFTTDAQQPYSWMWNRVLPGTSFLFASEKVVISSSFE